MTDPSTPDAEASTKHAAASPSPTLSVTDLTKSYRSGPKLLTALSKVQLTLPAGCFAALQGPSGSGKSTLLFVVAALLAPDSGSVLIDGTDLYQLRPSARARFRAGNIGMVFQDFRLIPYLDVRRNVLASTLATHRKDQTALADELIEQLGLTPRRHHLPKQLSAGEQQRTALARALLAKPKLLLADEPTGNLDPENSQQVLEQLRTFARNGGTVLAATHDPQVARAADQRIQINEGKLSS